MQKDNFYEESAIPQNGKAQARIYTVFTVVAVIFAVVTGIQILFSMSYVGSALESYEGAVLVVVLVQWFGLIVAFLAVIALCLFLRRRFNVSYDYTFVQDELRVSKVFNGKRRKFIKKLEAEHILKIGWMKNDSFGRICAGYSKKSIVALTPNREPSEGKDFYYIVYTTSLEKKIYIIEARQELLELLVWAAGMNKLERK